MPKGYTLRISDGSNIGPMDLDAVKGWCRKGLVKPDDLVLPPGGKKWIPLSRVVNFREVRAPAASPASASDTLRAAVRAAVRPRRKAAGGKATGASTAPSRATVETQPWRSVVGGVLLLLTAAGAAFFELVPERWIAALDAAPWRELALGQAALGLLLIGGWEPGRKFVRFVLVLAAMALFPAAAILFLQRVPWPAFAVMASALVFLAGLVGWLAVGRLPALRLLLPVIVMLAGGAGLVRFGLVEEHPRAERIREWALPDRRVDDPAVGMKLSLPASWVALRAEQDVVPAVAGARVVLAAPRRGGLAVLARAVPRRVLSAESLLDQVLAERDLPAYDELERGSIYLGTLPGLRLDGVWSRREERSRDAMVVAKDGLVVWSLAAWIPDDGSTRPGEELDALVAGLSLDGTSRAVMEQALDDLTAQVPFLTPAGAEEVVVSLGEPLPAAELVSRRALDLTARGRLALPVAEAAELDALNAAAYAQLSWGDRRRLERYVSRVLASATTPPADDRVMTPLLGDAVRGLSVTQQSRLRGLYEKAIAAGVAETSAEASAATRAGDSGANEP